MCSTLRKSASTLLQRALAPLVQRHGSHITSPLHGLKAPSILPHSCFSSQTLKAAQTPAVTATAAKFIPPKQWSQETISTLERLRSQDHHHAIVEIKERPYHVALNDIIITMRMNELSLGDEISLDRVREIGSTDYILRGNPYIYPAFFTIKAVVTEHPVSDQIVRHHWKKRGHTPVHVNRNHYTALRITSIAINRLGE